MLTRIPEMRPKKMSQNTRMSSQELKEARLRLGLSQQAMSVAMGVHRQTWVKWERGERQPDQAALTLVEALQFMSDRQCLADVLERKQGT